MFISSALNSEKLWSILLFPCNRMFEKYQCESLYELRVTVSEVTLVGWKMWLYIKTSHQRTYFLSASGYLSKGVF